MKSTNNIEQLINNITKAKNVTENLIEKSSKFAHYIQEQMESMGISELMSSKYKLIKLTASAGSNTSLYLNKPSYIRLNNVAPYNSFDVCLSTNKVSSERAEVMLYDDVSVSYNLPSRNDILIFIGDAEELLQELVDKSGLKESNILDKILSNT